MKPPVADTCGEDAYVGGALIQHATPVWTTDSNSAVSFYTSCSTTGGATTYTSGTDALTIG